MQNALKNKSVSSEGVGRFSFLNELTVQTGTFADAMQNAHPDGYIKKRETNSEEKDKKKLEPKTALI